MGEPEVPPQAPLSGEVRRPVWPTQAELDADDELVARAAAELGLDVPGGFVLIGLDADGQHTATNSGTADDFRAGIAILGRLNGRPVDECLAGMYAEPEAESGPRPEWMPPDDWSDTEAMDAWLAERARHPEWPTVYNGLSEWGVLLLGVGSSLKGLARLIRALAPTLTARQKRLMTQMVVEKAAEQNVMIDPADIIRAFDEAPSSPKRGKQRQIKGGKAKK